MKAVVIINPTSGPAGARLHSRDAIAREVLEAEDVEFKICLTQRRHHAYDLAAAAVEEGAEVIFAWGGDGTINEVAQALVSTESTLAVIPGGSGNGFARELGVPFEPRAAIGRALRLRDRCIDVGEIGGRMFVNVAGVGLDAKVALDVNSAKHARGLRPYVLAGTRELLSYFPQTYEITSDGGTWRSPALVIVVANSRQYGYGTRIAPRARLDDGRLDLVVIEPRSFVGNIARLPALFTGSIDRCAGVSTSQITEVRIRSDLRMLFHADGEVVEGEHELVARIHAGALRVRA